MQISVIIPIYQRQSYGERALRSVLAQSRQVDDIVLVDDASPDPFIVPPDLAADRRIRLIRHETNQLASGARNTGIAESRGEWLAFLDSDDYWLPDKLAGQVAFAEADQAICPNPMAFYATGFARLKNGGAKEEFLIPIESASASDFAGGCWFMPGSTVLIHKSLAEKVGPWDTKLARLEDLDWFLRAALCGAQLRVAPFVGAVIPIGVRPTPAVLENAFHHLSGKWLSPNGEKRLPPKARRHLAAYIHLERAAAAFAHDQPFIMALNFSTSLIYVPRVRLHIREWWRSTGAVSLPVSARPSSG